MTSSALPKGKKRPPVFYDVSGKRARRVLAGALLLLALLAGFIGWVTPQAFDPVWTSGYNRSSTFSEQLAVRGELKDTPVIGSEGVDALARVDRLVDKNGKLYLGDPFSETLFREVTSDEKERIGSHHYVLEWYGHPADHQLALTFDDGPDLRNTPQILDILSREGVRATFFVVGSQVVNSPELFQREIREGHMAGNHTLSHIGFNHGTLRDREELIGNDRVMRAADGYASRYFRIPEGDPDHNVQAVLQAQQLGYLCVDMDFDTLDWQYSPGDTIPMPKLDGKGHVVLMHDGGGNRAATVTFLPEFIKKAKSMGYTFVTPTAFAPKQFAPARVSPTIPDQATWLGLWFAMKLPAEVIKLLFWLGAGSLLIMSTLYVALALLNHRIIRRRKWPELTPRNAPFVTVGIPAFNEQQDIAACLDALLASDYPASKFEIIVVDDGSTDATAILLEVYALQHKQFRIKIVHQQNQGKWSALNGIFSEAQGKVVVTLDGDTIFEPQTVRMLARHFSDPFIGAVAGYVKVGNRHSPLALWQSLEYILGTGIDRTAGGLVNGILIVPGACSAWRRDAIKEIGGFTHDTMAEDCDATLGVRKLGYRVIQDSRAVALTEVPTTLSVLAKQRKRWMFGNFQAFFKHRDMLFRPKYGMLGMVTLPYMLFSIILPLVFMPFAYVITALNIISGDWKGLAIFAALVAGIYMIVTAIALMTVRERLWHLLVVPIYRLVYEPLRMYLLYAALFKAVRGTGTKWYTPPRQGMALTARKRRRLKSFYRYR